MSTFNSFEVFLQTIQDYARNGYTHYLLRKVNSEIEAISLSRKNSAIWNTHLNASNRYKAFRRGHSTAVHFTYSPKSEEFFISVLLVKPNKDFNILSEGIPFLNISSKSSRLTVFSYELFHDGVSWTWRMTSQEMNNLNKQIERIARSNPKLSPISQDNFGQYDTHAEKLQDQLYSKPGFRGIRKQVGILVQKFRGEWKRHRPQNGIQLRERTYLKYVKRLKRK